MHRVVLVPDDTLETVSFLGRRQRARIWPVVFVRITVVGYT